MDKYKKESDFGLGDVGTVAAESEVDELLLGVGRVEAHLGWLKRGVLRLSSCGVSLALMKGSKTVTF